MAKPSSHVCPLPAAQGCCPFPPQLPQIPTGAIVLQWSFSSAQVRSEKGESVAPQHACPSPPHGAQRKDKRLQVSPCLQLPPMRPATGMQQEAPSSPHTEESRATSRSGAAGRSGMGGGALLGRHPIRVMMAKAASVFMCSFSVDFEGIKPAYRRTHRRSLCTASRCRRRR